MKNYKLIIIPILLILAMISVNAITYNFPSNNNFYNTATNTSGVGIGNWNNTHVLVSNINGSLHKININTLVNEGKVSGIGLCNISGVSGLTTFKIPDNSTICWGGATGSSLLGYDSNGVLVLSTNTASFSNGLYVTKFNSSFYFIYLISSGNINRLATNNLGVFGINWLPYLNNSMVNTFGIVVNSLTSDNLFVQDGFDRFYFKFNNRYFYIDETLKANITDTNIVMKEATITFTNVTSNDKSIIISDKLFINTKNSNNQTSVYTSQDVDILSGLVLYNGVYYKNDSVCFNSVLGYGFFNASMGELQCKSFNSGGYCNGNLTLCTDGCSYQSKTNIYGVGYKEGVCLQGNCTNTCGVLGQLRSDTYTSYQMCAVQSNGCSAWSSSVSCLPNELSHNGICESVNTTINFITRLNYGVNPYVALFVPNTNPPVFNINLWNVTYEPTSNILTATTNTGLGGTGSFPLYIQVPFSYPSYYLGIDCNYKSTKNVIPIIPNEIRNNVPVEVINGSRDFTLNGQNRGYQKLGLIIDNSINVSEFSLSVEDVNAKIIQTTYFVLNKTNGELVAFQDDKTGSVLYTTTFSQGISLGKVEVELYEDFNSLKANSMLSLYRYVDNNNEPLIFSVGVGLQNYKDNLATTPYKIVLANYSNNISISIVENEIITSSINQLSTLISGTSIDYINAYDSTSCVYLNDGTYKARFYLSERLGNQYFSMKEITVIKQDVNTAQKLGGGGSAFNFSVLAKIFIALGSSVLIGLIFLTIGLLNDNDTIRKLMIFTGLFIVVIGIIAYTIAGWLPAWILITGIILAGLGVGVFFVSKSNGSD